MAQQGRGDPYRVPDEPPLAYAKRLLSSMAQSGDRIPVVLSKEERVQAIRLLCRDEKLPLLLRKKVIALLQKQSKKRGPKRMNLLPRDGIIVAVVAFIIQDYGLDATRNDATKDKDSAASIVSRALRELGEKKISEARVNKIYQGFNRSVRSAIKEQNPGSSA
jgi:hypothetical protein